MAAQACSVRRHRLPGAGLNSGSGGSAPRSIQGAVGDRPCDRCLPGAMRLRDVGKIAKPRLAVVSDNTSQAEHTTLSEIKTDRQQKFDALLDLCAPVMYFASSAALSRGRHCTDADGKGFFRRQRTERRDQKKCPSLRALGACPPPPPPRPGVERPPTAPDHEARCREASGRRPEPAVRSRRVPPFFALSITLRLESHALSRGTGALRCRWLTRESPSTLDS